MDVITPASEQVILGGTAFQPVARYRWTGNIAVTAPMAKMEFTGRDFIYTSTFTTPLTGLDFDTPEADIIFSTVDDSNRPISTLPKGRYHATATVVGSNTSERINDFEIAYTHDTRVFQAQSPLSQSYPEGPLDVRYLVHNAGLSDEADVGVSVDIFDRHDSLVYSRSVDTALIKGEYASVAFDDFLPVSKGYYRAKVRADIEDEGDSTDNSLSYYFHVGPSTQDPALIAPVSPAPNEVFGSGKRFDLKVEADWLGEFAQTRFCMVHVSIRECGSDNEVYYARNLVSIDGITTAVLPSTYGGRSVDEISAGCYKAFFTISRGEDLDTTDNHLEVPFTIEQSSGVVHTTSPSLSIERIQQIGKNVKVGVGTASNALLDYVLYDIRGERALTGTTILNDGYLVLDAGSLASGTYVLELRQGHDVTRRNFNYIK